MVEARSDVTRRHPKEGRVQIHVFASGQLRVEARAHLEQGSDSTTDVCVPGGRLCNAGQDFEERRLSCAVAADHCERLSHRDIERQVADRPQRLLRAATTHETLEARQAVLDLADPVTLS